MQRPAICILTQKIANSTPRGSQDGGGFIFLSAVHLGGEQSGNAMARGRVLENQTRSHELISRVVLAVGLVLFILSRVFLAKCDGYTATPHAHCIASMHENR